MPKAGAGLKRSAGPPQWIVSKRRAVNVGDVAMREANGATHNGPETGGGGVGPEDMTSRFRGLSTGSS